MDYCDLIQILHLYVPVRTWEVKLIFKIRNICDNHLRIKKLLQIIKKIVLRHLQRCQAQTLAMRDIFMTPHARAGRGEGIAYGVRFEIVHARDVT